ncbi:MAG: hypothetical protein K6F54_10505 [Lachnospiraceae bacterium]|nr:hypothetical protein [Lachnospiraceae bacterium]
MTALIILMTIIILSVIGCGSGSGSGSGSEESLRGILIVETRIYGDTEGSTTETVAKYTSLAPDDVLFDHFGSDITVKKVSPDHIVLTSGGGMVEPNKDGTINLSARSVKKIELEVGEEITLVTQTMDAGGKVNLRFVDSD